MNQEIRKEIYRANIKQWQVAKACGISENTLIRWLRDELTDERKQAIYKAIETVKGENAND